jgi:hypothetical protein
MKEHKNIRSQRILSGTWRTEEIAVSVDLLGFILPEGNVMG